jgi:methionyl aminopeptidase
MGRPLVFTADDIASFRAGGKILASCLAMLRERAVAGVTTMELDRLCETYIRDRGGVPAFKGYDGFPSSLCTSINDECVHGMPGPRALRDGDIVNLDSGVIYDGLYTDAGLMAKVGDVSADAHRVVDATEEALRRAIALVKGGVRVGDLSAAIEATAREFGCTPVKNLVGHGLGRTLHCEPDIPNEGRAGTGPALPAGTVVAIEPIFTLGGGDMRFQPDGWTIVSREGALCAQTEHSVLVTPEGAEILA